MLVILAILGLHALDRLGKFATAAAAQQVADMKLRERLELIGGQPEWIKQADKAEVELDLMQRQMLTVASAVRRRPKCMRGCRNSPRRPGSATPRSRSSRCSTFPASRHHIAGAGAPGRQAARVRAFRPDPWHRPWPALDPGRAPGNRRAGAGQPWSYVPTTGAEPATPPLRRTCNDGGMAVVFGRGCGVPARRSGAVAAG
ncbi:hypothetical protein H1235_03450 [Pseudoxanthomonas sp. NC8]|nr:hypothetical protein H1235_03450 [Pseudoxanthomonas sp. NC8]